MPRRPWNSSNRLTLKKHSRSKSKVHRSPMTDTVLATEQVSLFQCVPLHNRLREKSSPHCQPRAGPLPYAVKSGTQWTCQLFQESWLRAPQPGLGSVDSSLIELY